ncbi:MAG TPA: hypothetical protein VK934_10960 [Fimbriimonas sp.]|nr:hypothetical protein [Fimbriimonas sp.]
MSAGYSGTPLPKKLGLKEGSRLLLIGAPDGFDLGHPQAVEGPYDVIVFFVEWRVDLESHLDGAIETLAERGGLWIAWPKRASKMPTDITENTLRDVILPTGMVDNKVCAIDDTWSALRFVRRLKKGGLT